MSDSDLLPAVEIDPAGPIRSTVIWLHGLGADGHDFEPIVPHLGLDPALGTRFVFPHAPRRAVTINMGLIMPAWYDIKALDLEREIDEGGLADSSEAVEAWIDAEIARGVTERSIVLAGFSQGGAVAYDVAARRGARLAGICALSTYQARKPETTSGLSGCRILAAHGTFDPMVPIEAGRLAVERNREAGADVEWHEYPCQHEVAPDEIRRIGEWLGEVLAESGAGSGTK